MSLRNIFSSSTTKGNRFSENFPSLKTGGRHPCGLGAVQGDHLRLLHVWAYLTACVFAETTAVRNIWVISEGFSERDGFEKNRAVSVRAPNSPPTKIKTSRLRKDDKGEQVVG